MKFKCSSFLEKSSFCNVLSATIRTVCTKSEGCMYQYRFYIPASKIAFSPALFSGFAWLFFFFLQLFMLFFVFFNKLLYFFHLFVWCCFFLLFFFEIFFLKFFFFFENCHKSQHTKTLIMMLCSFYNRNSTFW